MPSKSTKPCILLAFANEQGDSSQYLRQLPNELRQLERILRRVQADELCDFRILPNATLADILDALQDLRDHLAIFHFAGHSDSYRLMLESESAKSEAAHSVGLAEFLSQQRTLRLVLLNGCANEAQADDLLKVGVPAVIATAGAINDASALDFSVRFYKALATGASLATAFEESVAELKTRRGNSPRSSLHWMEGADPQDRFPWGLYPAKPPPAIANWNLPNAARNPLVALPGLADDIMPPREPFLHLAPFRREDAGVFFGRGYEIRELYNLVVGEGNAPLILYCGQTGVGKSSLLSAGLLTRVEASYDIARTERRSSGLTASVIAALGGGEGRSLLNRWRDREASTGKPLLVVLDQAERVFTESRDREEADAEVASFLGELEVAFGRGAQLLKGKLILAFREEWLARFEHRLEGTGIRYERQLLEPLGPEGVAYAVRGPSQISEYRLDVEEGLPETIAQELKDSKNSPIAPTLAVLLAKLWKEAKAKSRTDVDCRRRFEEGSFRTLQEEGLLLDDFLEEQLEKLAGLSRAASDSGLVLDVLNFHVTELGTAAVRRDVPDPDADKQPSDPGQATDIASRYGTNASQARQIIDLCYELRLLRPSRRLGDGRPDSWLIHDALGPLIRRRHLKSQRPGQRAMRLLENRTPEWEGEKTGHGLSEVDLTVVEAGDSGMRAWTDSEQRLVEASRKERERRGHRRRAGYTVVAAAIAGMMLAGAAGWILWGNAGRAATEAQRLLSLTYWQRGVELRDRDARPVEAAHWFARAAASPDRRLADSARLAAYDAIRGYTLEQIIEHPGLRDAAWSSDNSQILTWGGNTVRLWHAITGRDVIAPLRHEEVFGATFNSDETQILSWSRDGTLRLWEAATGEAEFAPLHHEGWVSGAAFNEDGTRILSWGQNGMVRLWDAATREQVIAPLRHEGRIEGAAFSRDESQILSWGQDRTVRLWDAATSEQVIAPLRHEGPVEGAAFSRDESQILSWGEDKTVRLWDSVSGDPVITPLWHKEVVLGAVFNGIETQILSWSMDGTVQLWDAATGDSMIPPLRHESAVGAAMFNSNESHILSWSLDGTVRLWDAATGEAEIAPLRHEGLVLGAAFNKDETQILSWGSDGTVRLWDAATEQMAIAPLSHEKLVAGAAFNGDESRIMGWSNEGTVRVWSATKDQNPIASLLHPGEVNGAAFTIDGTRILSWSNHGSVQLWDASTGKLVLAPLRHEGLLGAVFNNDETRILSWGGDGAVRLWDSTSGEVIIPPLRHARTVVGAAFNKNEAQILSWSSDGTVRLWDAATGEAEFAPLHHEGLVSGAAFNEDETRILSWGQNGIVRLWDAATGEAEIALLRHEGVLRGATFNRDATRILSWSSDGTVRLDAATGDSVIPPLRHEKPVGGAAFNSNGSQILSWSSDGTVRLLDAATGQMVIAPLLHESFVNGAIFNRDETHILSWGFDGLVQLWSVATGGLAVAPLRHASWVYGAAFSRDEIRILTWSLDRTVRLWDSATARQVIAPLVHEMPVLGAAFNRDETKILSLTEGGTMTLWNLHYYEKASTAQLLACIEAHTGTRVTPSSFDVLAAEEWQRVIENRASAGNTVACSHDAPDPSN